MSGPTRRAHTGATRFEWLVAVRYLRTARQDALVRLLARIAGVGLGLGTAALILCLAALSGFQSRLLGAVRANTAPLQVEVDSRDQLQAVRPVVEQMLGEAAVQELRVARGWLTAEGRTASVEYFLYDGPLPSWLGRAVPIARFDGNGGAPDGESAAAEGAWVTSRLLRLGGAADVEVISPRPTLSPAGPVPRSRWLPLVGVLETSDVEEAWGQRVALPLSRRSRSLFAEGDLRLDVDPTRVAQERLAEIGGEEALGDALRAALEPLGVKASQVYDWRDRNRALLFVLQLEKSVVFLAVALIVLVASFALLSTLQLLLANKRGEIGILGAMGATPGSIRGVFLRIGLMLAGGGALTGALLGTLLAVTLDRFELLRIPGDLLILDYVPFSVRPVDVAVVVMCALGTTTLVSLVGAQRAARLRVAPTVRV